MLPLMLTSLRTLLDLGSVGSMYTNVASNRIPSVNTSLGLSVEATNQLVLRMQASKPLWKRKYDTVLQAS